MVYFDFPEIESIHKAISEKDIYQDPEDSTFGLEIESHVTLLYGLHSDEIGDKEVFDACGKNFNKLTLTNLSLFSNEKYDVLKFDVKGKELFKANERLSKFPHTTNFPEYHPHCTVAYLKSGHGKKVIKELNKLFSDEFTVFCTKIVYSKPNGTKIKEKL